MREDFHRIAVSGVRRCAENMKLMQDMKQKIHEVVSTRRSLWPDLPFSWGTSGIVFGSAEIAFVNNFIISVVTAALQVQKQAVIW